MNEMRDKFLPVGSVVLLKNATKRIMVIGYCTVDNAKPDVVYDYSGVLFPEGSLSSDQTLLFNHDQIAKIDHIGLEDEEEKKFQLELNKMVSEQKIGATPVAPAAPAQPTATDNNPSTPVA